MLEELYIGDLKEDGDRRAIREANKISRRSLLTHPELIQRHGTQVSHAWPQAALATSIVIATAALLLVWMNPETSGASWEAMRTAWLSAPRPWN